MSSTTLNMGLIRWDLSVDPYDHNQLAANFLAIDTHDHSAGKGVKIGSGGIQNNAIINALIATGAVDSRAILDGSIGVADISNALWDIMRPLGDTLWRWLPAGQALDLEVDSGGRWVLARGQTITAANHSFSTGGASITLPDPRNAYPLGADTAGTGTTPGVPPASGAIVGAHTADLRHTHTVNAHTHNVAGHSHTVNSHLHAVLSHSHGINADSATNKFFDDFGTPQAIATRTGATSGGSTFQSLYVPGATDEGGGSRALAAQVHSHGDFTQSASTFTDSQSPGTNSVGLTTDSQSPGTGNPNTDFSAIDKRPRSLGLLCYIKVKY